MSLLISEYVEGSSNNKAIELYNNSGSLVDLGANGYTLEFYFNGNTSAGTVIDLTGTVEDGEVFVIADNDADAAILAETDFTSNSSFFNGDDAIANDIVDILNTPDIIGLQEVQDNSGSADDGTVAADANLEQLIDAIAEAGGPQSFVTT